MSLRSILPLLPGLPPHRLLVYAITHVSGAVPKDHGAIGAPEGPAWKDGSLYFTDGKHINRLGPEDKTAVFRHNASNVPAL